MRQATNRLAIVIIAMAPQSLLAGAPARAEAPPSSLVEFETSELSWSNLDVSPDGRRLVLDVLGDLYALPIGGGRGVRLTDGRAIDERPRFSPSGRIIYWSDGGAGAGDWWALDGSLDPVRLTDLNRRWVPAAPPDWKAVDACIREALAAARADRDAPSSCEGLTAGAGSGTPAVPRGNLSCRNGKFRFPEGASSFGLQFSRSGRSMLFFARHQSETTLFVLDSRSLRCRLALSSSLLAPLSSYAFSAPAPAFSADEQSLFALIGGRIVKIDLRTGSLRPIPFIIPIRKRVAPRAVPDPISFEDEIRLRHYRWLTLSKDRKTALFSALGKLWSWDAGRRSYKRVTTQASDLEYGPSLSPDGRRLLYVSLSPSGEGSVCVHSPGIPKCTAVSSRPGRYFSPSWSLDGKRIAYLRRAAGTPQDSRCLDVIIADPDGQDEQVLATIRDGQPAEVAHHFPVLTFSPDGKKLFVLDAPYDGPKRLLGMDLRSGRSETLFELPHEIDRVIPSPDGRHFLLTTMYEAWVLDSGRIRTGDIDRGIYSSGRAIPSFGGYYPYWQDSDTIVWTLNGSVYEWSAKSGATSIVAEVAMHVPRPRGRSSMAFVNANIISMAGVPGIFPGCIVISGDRISQLEQADGCDLAGVEQVMDLSGQYVIPGLIDSHAHPHFPNRTDPEYFPFDNVQYDAALAYGITTIMDPSANDNDVFARAEFVETGILHGPRIYSSGQPIHGAGAPVSFPSGRGTWEAAGHIASIKKRSGAIMVKNYAIGSRAERLNLVNAARAYSMGATGEGGTDNLSQELAMIEDGYTSLEHDLTVPTLYADWTEYIARTGFQISTTRLEKSLSVKRMRYFYRSWGDGPRERKFRTYAAPELERRELERESKYSASPFEQPGGQGQGLAGIVRAGGKVSAGSHGDIPGLGLHWELRLLVEAGMTPAEALQTVTIFPAERLGLQKEIGSLEVGKAADLVVLRANPLIDIANTESVRFTVKGGEIQDLVY